jgi:signal transduction histidine kinase
MNLLALGVSCVPVLVGVVVLARSAQSRIGWLLVADGLSWGLLFAFPGQGTTHAELVVEQLAAGSWVFLFGWLALIAYLLPDGHAASRRWRIWVQVGLCGVASFMVGAAGDGPGFRSQHDGADPPISWLPQPVSGLLGVVGLALTVAFLLGAAVAARSRLRRAIGDVRLQLLWLVWGATSLPAALGLAWVGHFLLDDNEIVINAALVLAGVTLPVTIGIAILRYRLFDIQVVLSRTLVYGTLTALVLAAYAGLVQLTEAILGRSSPGGLLAVGLVAVAAQPTYAALRVRIERWVYGYRSDPAAALRRLGTDVESADPLQVVDTITASVADALKVDRVWLDPIGAEPPADPNTVTIPLVHRGEHIGSLVVQVPTGRPLSASDTELLHDLARHAAVTLRVAQLAVELQGSRSKLVTAREEERKRLRRDLHDGLGPSLAAIALKLQAAQSRTTEAEREALLTEVRDETKGAITEVRRVVDDLRPPAIDEVGLVGAIRQRALSLSTDVLTFHVRGPLDLPVLPAAVEVAAFRIASEAMANVAKHSGASRCTVELTLDAALGVTVSDNGRGQLPGMGTGVGWPSMRERAAELGGACTMTSRADGGLVVTAALPLQATAADEVLA